jgi:cyclase
LITEGANRFGSQCIVVAIDVKKKKNHWEVFSHGGTRGTGFDAYQWALEAERRGAGEILLTSMDADGQKKGYDLAITSKISRALNIPVIASGGGGLLHHFKEALEAGAADAVLAASIFHYGQYSVSEVKQYLHAQHIPVRLTSA